MSTEKKYLPITTRVTAMSADRPQRSNLNNMPSHSSHSAKRWMYSTLTDPHKMASCAQCSQRRIPKLFHFKILVRYLFVEDAGLLIILLNL